MIIGQKFGRLTVIAPTERSGYWLFRCDCGEEKILKRYRVKTGHTSSSDDDLQCIRVDATVGE
jgi:hypothetical protein